MITVGVILLVIGVFYLLYKTEDSEHKSKPLEGRRISRSNPILYGNSNYGPEKLGSYWLDCFDENTKQNWINNYNWKLINGSYVKIKPTIPMEEFLGKEYLYEWFLTGSFEFDLTPQGFDYWIDVLCMDPDIMIKNQRNYKLKQLGI